MLSQFSSSIPMENAEKLIKQFVDYRESLKQEGSLNDQFTQILQLQDESSPNFFSELMPVFYDNSQKLLNALKDTLNEKNVDFHKLSNIIHQLKGSTSSIGAQRVENVCICFRDVCSKKDMKGCLRLFEEASRECALVIEKLKSLVDFERQLTAAGIPIPVGRQDW